MALINYRLGDCVKLYSERCGNPDLTIWDISGVNNDKEFFEPSKQAGADTSNYKIVPPKYFACNLMHVGRDKVLPIAYNHTDSNKIVSPAYTVFALKDGTPLLREYFFIMLKSDERDRYFWFHTDSSVRDGMSWDDFCDLDLAIPTVEIQQKYVDVYNAMLANQQNYERGLEDLKLVCDAYIEDLRRNNEIKAIGPYMHEESNIVSESKGKYTADRIFGISSIDKCFMETKADISGVSVSSYKIVKPNEFSFNPNTARMGDRIPIALNDTDLDCLVSAIYPVFSIDETVLVPEYLMMWFKRSEFDRYTRFNSWGSARETFNFPDMQEVEIPIPDKEIQEDIVSIYNAYMLRREINEQLKAQIRDLCPILIKGSVEEARA